MVCTLEINNLVTLLLLLDYLLQRLRGEVSWNGRQNSKQIDYLLIRFFE